MNFFSKFPSSTYEFSDNRKTVITDLFRYVSAEDKKLDGIINYTYYSVPEGMRPDVLSSKLYGTSDFHWTFFIINTALKHAGLASWPKGIAELENFIFEKYMKYGVLEMNSKTIPYTYTLYDVGSGIGTVKNTTINTKSLNGIVLDSDISLVSLDKNYKLEFLSYKDDRIAVNKNIVSSLSFSANNNIYWNLPKITLISDEGYNAEVSFKFSDSVKGRGSILSDEIDVLNAGENYFTVPEVLVDESPERDCVFSFNTTTGALVISYSGQNYCRVPKLIIKANGYTSEFLNVFEIDITKNYGLKALNGAYTLPENIRTILVSNPNYVLELSNSDEPLNVPLVYVSNSSEIDQNFETFTLENNSSDNVKTMKWNLDLLTWISNYRIDSIIVNNFITSTDLFNFYLTQDMGLRIYNIAKDIQEKANETSLNPSSVTDTSIRLKVTEMVTYFTGTYYYPLAKEIQKVFTDSGINFNLPNNYLKSIDNAARLFYDGINYENKTEGSLIGLSDGWNIPVYSFGTNRPLYTAPTFSLENLYGPYQLSSGRGSIKFGPESIAVKKDLWTNKSRNFAGSERWYSFKLKKVGNNPQGVFNILTHNTDARGKSIGIKISGNTIYDSSVDNAYASPFPDIPGGNITYIHNFGNQGTEDSQVVTILGYIAHGVGRFWSSRHSVWFNPDETKTAAQLLDDTYRTRRSYYLVGSSDTPDPIGINDNAEQRLSGIGFQNNTGFIVDEIRIGETFESVTKNPAISIPEIQNYLSETAKNKIVGPIIENLIFETQSVYADAQNATHHYEDSDGNQLSYYTGVNDLNGPNNVRITNFEYEVALNDQRREIKIVRPEYIKQFDSVYNTLINS